MKFLIALTLNESNNDLVDIISKINEKTNYQDVLVINGTNDYRTEMMLINNGISHINTSYKTTHADCLSIAFQYSIDNEYDGLIEFDSSGKLDPNDIPYMIATFKNSDVDIVFGSRYKNLTKKSKKPNFRSRMLSFFIKRSTKKKITDPGLPFAIYSKRVFKWFDQKSYWKLGPDSISYLLRNNYSFKEVQINCEHRKSIIYKSIGQSFWNTWHEAWSIMFVQSLRKKEGK